MAESEPVLSLAGLRRSKLQRRRPATGHDSPTLFDLVAPETEPDAQQANSFGAAVITLEQRSAAVPASPMEQTAPARAKPEAQQISATPQATVEPLSVEPQLPAPERARIWTVSSLVHHVRGHVEEGYGRVTLEGEISNWRPSGSGHCYFTVKDTGAQLSAVLFRRQASLLRFEPRDGDAVKLHGQLSVYENRGQLQLIVEWMQQAGVGALLAEVQRLKERLRKEGLFDRKRPLPAFPRCIGVITSAQGAALRDIVKVCRRRHASVRLLIYSAAVQGPNCASEVTAGLRWFNAHPDQAEVVLVARGGGSWEDLHGFDHEQVARAIAGCALPVITGIGHATDSTVADAVADVCAPTPSAAAELLTAAQHRVEEHVARLHARLLRSARFEMLQAQQRLARLGAANVLRRTEDALNRRAQQLDELGYRAQASLVQRTQRLAGRLRSAETRLARQEPTVRLQSHRRKHEAATRALKDGASQQIAARRRRLEAAEVRLRALSPLRVLERGYALIYSPDGSLLRDAGGIAAGDHISARIARGSLQAQVLTATREPVTGGFAGGN